MRIAITQGEPAGIGPEILLKALARFRPAKDLELEVLGDPELLAETAERLRVPRPRGVRPVAGESVALAALEEAARMARAGRADAVVTAPVNKARLRAAGFEFPGQTEFFAATLGAGRVAMMLTDDRLRVVPATIHVALADVPEILDTGSLTATLLIVDRALRADFDLECPRIAVLGLNPHAGERGHFGGEEERLIAPAVRAAVEEGVDAVGPIPADTAFAARVRRRYDAIVGMYHDQALGPFKALAEGGGVNVTLGLPVVRTSPDHGTAEDIAGTGSADESSMLLAIEMAERLARNRARSRP